MSGFADATELTIPCPKCGKELKGKLGRLYRDKKIPCPACGPIALTGDGLAKIKAALDNAERKLAKLSRTIKLKF